MEPKNQFQGMNSASLCSLAGRYDNPIHTRCLAPIDCLKIPAQTNKNIPYRKRIIQRPNTKKSMVYAGVDYNLTLCPLHSRLQNIYYGQLNASVDFIPQSGTLIWPLYSAVSSDPLLHIMNFRRKRGVPWVFTVQILNINSTPPPPPF
jgi:hypothetical protein